MGALWRSAWWVDEVVIVRIWLTLEFRNWSWRKFNSAWSLILFSLSTGCTSSLLLKLHSCIKVIQVIASRSKFVIVVTKLAEWAWFWQPRRLKWDSILIGFGAVGGMVSALISSSMNVRIHLIESPLLSILVANHIVRVISNHWFAEFMIMQWLQNVIMNRFSDQVQSVRIPVLAEQSGAVFKKPTLFWWSTFWNDSQIGVNTICKLHNNVPSKLIVKVDILSWLQLGRIHWGNAEEVFLQKWGLLFILLLQAN